MWNDKKLRRALLAAGATLALSPALGQGLGNSPYSRLGLGDFNPNTGGVRQQGMGGVGLAAPNSVNVNELNPALLHYTLRTTWEAAFNAQTKTVRNADASTQVGTGTLGYLALAVPITAKWGVAVGLKPLSSVDYESNVRQGVEGDPNGAEVLKQYQGAGGLSEAYFAHGYHLLRDLSIGVSASYVFGTVDQTTGTAVVPAGTAATERVVLRDQLRYSDFAFRGALHYRRKVGDNLNLNLAGVYTFRADLKTDRDRTQERQDANGALLSAASDLGTEQGQSVLPAQLQGGVTLDNNKNWSASFDLAQQRWGDFQTFGQTPASPFRNTLRYGLGGEFTPDPGSVEHYFQRVTYRVGLSVAEMPYQFGGRRLYDRAVSWGFAFPLPTATPLEATTVSLAFTYGVRGNTDFVNSDNGASNVRENYLRLQAGVTLNNRWFIKRRLQ